MRILKAITWVLLAIQPAISNTSGRIRSTTGAASPIQSSAVSTGSFSVTGQTAGPTPFIVNVRLLANPPASVQSVRFSIAPKPGSVTRPVAATYFADYLQNRGYLDTQTGNITVPVFGLYSNFSNNVTLTCCFSDGTSQQANVNINTPPFSDPCGHDSPTVLQARTNAALSYDFMLVRGNCNAAQGPFVLDSDGAIRWVGNIGQANINSLFFDNAIYMATKPTNSNRWTALTRVELDGASTQLADYASLNVVELHHNFDPGKQGILVEADTTTQIEATIFEVNLKGQILKTWNIADIVSAAMTAGGDDPTQFVKPSPTDWFHNNSATYRRSDNTLVISGREDFVIGIDYDTGAIKWILGDSTKKWYQFQSLRNFALALAPGSLPPIGQHTVSFTQDDHLLLFDNGEKSATPSNTPAGIDRTYNAPREYRLDLGQKIATEVWNYPMGQAYDSRFCSGVYEDAPDNFLVDYALLTNIPAPNPNLAELIGLSPAGDKVFDYRYTTSGCSAAFNSVPLHWEKLVFTGPAEIPLRITGVVKNGLDRIFSFQGIQGNSYRLEYKNFVTDTNWVSLGTRIPDCSGSSMLTDVGVGDTTRFYRVQQLPAPTPSPANPVSVNDSILGTGNNQWNYSAGWAYALVGSPSPGFLQDEHYSFTTNSTVGFRFSGTQVKIYTIKEPAGGNIGYSLDGGPEQIISNYSGTRIGNALSYTSPVVSAGNHNLVIRVVGTHEAAATSNTITVDRAEVFQ